MKYFFFQAIFLFVSTTALQAQPVNQAANNVFIITRMAEKFHIQPKAVNKELSANWFDELMQQLDNDKIFFTQEDITRFQPYRLQLDNELLNKKTGFLQLLVTTYQQKVQQIDTMIDNLCKQPFRFSTNEKLTAAEDTSYALNTAAQRQKIYKHLKASTLEVLLEWNENVLSLKPEQKKKATDSLEIIVRKKIQAAFKRSVNKLLQSPGGIVQQVCTVYCQSLAVCFDPHTAFFPPSEKENFESSLGNTPLQFGFGLKEDEAGDVVIQKLKPGSPAFKSGQLNKGDKIQSVQWEGKEPIDVSGAGGRELSEILSASNHEKLILTVKKADGAISHVTLAKEKAEPGEDDNKVKSFLLKGTKTIGYISLPAFYTEWQNNDNPGNGCADDVAKEIVKLKKENIEGLIIDLRYNGGGSVQEAVDLAGIFIDAGPVAQIKSRDAKVYTMKDVNRGSIYDGPLLLLVNGYSASASEMVAGTLQDYNRAVIAGSATYGKATGQVVLPMDTTINLNEDFQNKHTENYLKITIEKLYRITGSSAQARGVQPDIVLPDMLEADPHREMNEHFSFAASSIEPNKYYKPNAALPLAALQAYAKTQTDTAAYFKALRSYIQVYRQHLQAKDVSLNWSDAIEERKKDKLFTEMQPPLNKTKPSFSVTTHSFEERRVKADEDLRALDENWKERLLQDPYVQIAFGLLSVPLK
jgi:carboxyl-terminal processing protease